MQVGGGVYVSDETKRDLVLSAIGGETDAGEAQDHKSPGCGSGTAEIRSSFRPYTLAPQQGAFAAATLVGKNSSSESLRVQRGKKLP